MKTYYQQMETPFNETVKYYKDDFYKWDKAALSEGIQEFIWAIRETGTTLLRLDPQYYEEVTLDNIQEARHTAHYMVTGVLGNERFFYATQGIIAETTRQEIDRIIDDRFEQRERQLREQARKKQLEREAYETRQLELRRERESRWTTTQTNVLID